MSNTALEIPHESIDLLFPLHITVTPDGRIETVGPTLAKVFKETIIGLNFFEVFSVIRPRRVTGMDHVRERLGSKIVVSGTPDGGSAVQFRCFAAALKNSSNLLLDLAFGVNLAEAMQRFELTGSDFKPNDFAIDLYYTFQTQSTLLEDSQKMASALKKAKIEAEIKANQDPLTAIANRGPLYSRIDKALSETKQASKFALLHIDLDEFKSVNDNFGHTAGDEVLLQTAAVLTANSGENDLPARIGGDEFALLLSDPPDAESLKHFAEDLVTAIATPIRVDGQRVSVGASIGIVTFGPGEFSNSDRLLASSDIALYEAKNSGSSAELLTPNMITRHQNTARLIDEIERGLRESQFIPYFQPQIDIASNRIYGLEVLARWDHPTHGVLAPCRFLKAAMRANIINDIDRQVRRKAFACLGNWKSAGRSVGRLSLNVTASNVRSPEFRHVLEEELLAVGLSSADIQLELLESILFDKSDSALISQCQDLDAAGFSLALDDFGTGHSSIATLVEAPVSLLKIDRSFITGLDRNPKMQRIAGAMLAMAGNMGLAVLAEGVETPCELNFLKRSGCTLFQGYHFSPPRSAHEFGNWLDLHDSQAHLLSAGLNI